MWHPISFAFEMLSCKCHLLRNPFYEKKNDNKNVIKSLENVAWKKKLLLLVSWNLGITDASNFAECWAMENKGALRIAREMQQAACKRSAFRKSTSEILERSWHCRFCNGYLCFSTRSYTFYSDFTLSYSYYHFYYCCCYY